MWRSIVEHLELCGSQTEFISVTDVPRETFARHPWSIGGGGAAELKELLENNCKASLKNFVTSIGFASFPGLDDAFVIDRQTLIRKGIQDPLIKPFVYGEILRDWTLLDDLYAFTPYQEDFTLIEYDHNSSWSHHLWFMRNSLEKIVQ